jgi:hypothetical protein
MQQVARLVDQDSVPDPLRDDKRVSWPERHDLGILDVVVQ